MISLLNSKPKWLYAWEIIQIITRASFYSEIHTSVKVCKGLGEIIKISRTPFPGGLEYTKISSYTEIYIDLEEIVRMTNALEKFNIYIIIYGFISNSV